MMASLNPFNKTRGRHGGSSSTSRSSGGRGGAEAVPRSYAVNGVRSSSERLPEQGDDPLLQARRQSESAVRSEFAASAGGAGGSRADGGVVVGEWAPGATAMAPKATVGLTESKADEDSPSVLYKGRYEEAECNMPMISELADATEMSLTTSIVTRGELDLVQNRLEWDVSRVTAMHFLGYYTSQGVTAPDDTCQGRRLVEKVVTYMNKYVDFFANLCQQGYQFQRYKPSHIAAAAILTARRALCIKPMWRDELTDLTGYKLEEISDCGEDLWHFYEKMFPLHRSTACGNRSYKP
ncbi:cyclin D1 [Ectocarpus siliculosus]|uniref:Cyclin D1 n=1 Tax=Ectocarpus siliculosus TaxID=2880 RepID=D8LIL5_ECTSI|nr:cyclin D1 [Ectocarpus siliculosus]|eukprot:CBN75925.1 cyclin D1 [Ectocarpus siliculosus]